jgi:hypothetical protein
VKSEGRNPAFPFTLDLRRQQDFDGGYLQNGRPMGEQ